MFTHHFFQARQTSAETNSREQMHYTHSKYQYKRMYYQLAGLRVQSHTNLCWLTFLLIYNWAPDLCRNLTIWYSGESAVFLGWGQDTGLHYSNPGWLRLRPGVLSVPSLQGNQVKTSKTGLWAQRTVCLLASQKSGMVFRREAKAWFLLTQPIFHGSARKRRVHGLIQIEGSRDRGWHLIFHVLLDTYYLRVDHNSLICPGAGCLCCGCPWPGVPAPQGLRRGGREGAHVPAARPHRPPSRLAPPLPRQRRAACKSLPPPRPPIGEGGCQSSRGRPRPWPAGRGAGRGEPLRPSFMAGWGKRLVSWAPGGVLWGVTPLRFCILAQASLSQSLSPLAWARRDTWQHCEVQAAGKDKHEVSKIHLPRRHSSHSKIYTFRPDCFQHFSKFNFCKLHIFLGS